MHTFNYGISLTDAGHLHCFRDIFCNSLVFEITTYLVFSFKFYYATVNPFDMDRFKTSMLLKTCVYTVGKATNHQSNTDIVEGTKGMCKAV